MAKQEYNPSGKPVGELVLIREAISLGGGANTNLVNWNKNAPVRAQVVDFWYNLTAAGPAASSTIQLRKGNGAASETFSAISDALAVGTTADTNQIRCTTLNDANWVIDKDESLNISAVASTGTHTGEVCVLLQLLGD